MNKFLVFSLGNTSLRLAKNLMQTSAKSYEVFAVKFAYFVHKVVRRYLSVVRKCFYHLQFHQTFIVLPFCQH